MSEPSLLNSTEALPGACGPDYFFILDKSQGFMGPLSELIACHLYLENQLSRLHVHERDSAMNHLLRLQQGELLGIAGGKELREAKAKLEDIDQKIEAVNIGMVTVRSKMSGNILGAAAMEHDTEIPAAIESHLQSKNRSTLAYLDAFLVALAEQAKIRGPLLMITHRGDAIPGPPGLHIKPENLSEEQQNYFYTRYLKQVNSDSGIDEKIASLAAESDRLANFLNLDDAALEEEVERVLVAAGSQAFNTQSL